MNAAASYCFCVVHNNKTNIMMVEHASINFVL